VGAEGKPSSGDQVNSRVLRAEGGVEKKVLRSPMEKKRGLKPQDGNGGGYHMRKGGPERRVFGVNKNEIFVQVRK